MFFRHVNETARVGLGTNSVETVDSEDADDKQHYIRSVYLLTKQSPIARMTAPTHAATMMIMTTEAAETAHRCRKDISITRK